MITQTKEEQRVTSLALSHRVSAIWCIIAYWQLKTLEKRGVLKITRGHQSNPKLLTPLALQHST